MDAIEPIKRPRGRPRKRPEKLHADKAYDDKKCAWALRKRGIKRRIARKDVESSEKSGRHRWIVERTLAWMAKYRRLTIRLRAARGHPRGVPVSGVFSDLSQLPLMSVLKGSLSSTRIKTWTTEAGSAAGSGRLSRWPSGSWKGRDVREHHAQLDGRNRADDLCHLNGNYGGFERLCESGLPNRSVSKKRAAWCEVPSRT